MSGARILPPPVSLLIHQSSVRFFLENDAHGWFTIIRTRKTKAKIDSVTFRPSVSFKSLPAITYWAVYGNIPLS